MCHLRRIGSTNNRLNLKWSIQITDPESTCYTWTIQCSNGQRSNGTSIINGIQSMYLTGLTYSKTYTVWVNATDPTGSGKTTSKWYTFTTENKISFTMPTLKWSITSSGSGESRVCPTVADLNNDKIFEIIRSGINGIIIYNGATGAVVKNLLTMTMWDSHIPLECIDLNNDGYLDIITSYNTGTAAYSGKDYSQLWYNSAAPLYNKHAVAGDVNKDGYPEVFVCTAGSEDGYAPGKITYLDHNGNTIKQITTYFPCYGGVSLGDTNRDGTYELYMGERNYGYHGYAVGKGVRAFKVTSTAPYLTEIWNHPEMLSSSLCPTLVDTNKDRILDVVTLQQSGHGIAIFNSADGSVIHSSLIPGLKVHSAPTIYDIDHDGNLEALIGGGSDIWSDRALVLDLYTWSVDAWLPFKCWEPPAIADLNGDGRVEIFECTPDNISIFDDNYVWRGAIALTNNRSGTWGYYGMSMIIAQDIDNDAKLELVLNRYNQVYVYDTNGAAPTPLALSQYCYYSQHRGRAPYYLPSVGYLPFS